MPPLYSLTDVQAVVYGPSRNHGFGFNIVDNRRLPVASFNFTTEAEAKKALNLIATAIEKARNEGHHF